MIGMDAKKPFFNGRPFDDTYGMHESVKRELCYQGMLYLTSFKYGGATYCGVIIARSEDHALQRAEDRSLSETVDGRLEMFGEYP